MSPPTDDTTLGTFEGEVLAFFDGRPKKAPTNRSFVWGEGPDDVPLFAESDRSTDSELLDLVRTWRRELADGGLSWITGPKEFGGRELPSPFQRAFDEIAKRYDVPSSSTLTVSLGMVAPTILAHGSAEAKSAYLRPLHSADLIACQLFSEPGAGSDLASVTTSARRDGHGWRVTGQKVWTSGAHFSDIGEILCRTAPEPRHRNLTAFLIDMRQPGVTVRPLRQMTGGAAFNEVFVDDVFVPDSHRLGDVNAGWAVALTTLMNERGAIGASGLGGIGLLSTDRMRALLQHFGASADPATRQRFAKLYSNIRVGSYLRRRAEAGSRRGQPGPELTVGKLMLCRTLEQLSELVSHVLGARLTADSGEWGTFAWNEFILGLPGYRIGGGTDEILKSVIGERILGLPKGPH